MHVKYASRHALYPVPNVFDAADVAARAGVRAARDIVVVVPIVRAGVRAFFCAVALRAELPVETVVPRAVRAVVVALRDVVARDCAVALRFMTGPVRVVAVVALRDVALCDVVGADARFMLDVSRTAALAKPMPTTTVPTKSKNFFIITYQ